MIKPSDQSSPGRPRSRAAGDRTREQLLDAALRTVREQGYAGCSARMIARTGGLSPALIFYHFGSVDELLLAALDRTSAQRLAHYRQALQGVSDLGELLEVVQRLAGEEIGTSHIAAVQELIGSGTFSRRCGPRLMEQLQVWVDFAHEVVTRVLAGSPLGATLDAGDVAFAAVALYLGIETVWRLQGGRAAQIDSLLTTARRFAPLLSQVLGGAPPASGRPRRPTRVTIT